MKIAKRIVSPKKLLNSKWTAVTPTNKEKHFVVIKLVLPAEPDQMVELVELEAIHSKRVQTLSWQSLNDEATWLQGWQ